VKTKGSAFQCESTEAQKGLGILGEALGIGRGQGRADRQLPCNYIPNVRYRIVCTSLHLTFPRWSAYVRPEGYEWVAA
jgi:hypothetical protein